MNEFLIQRRKNLSSMLDNNSFVILHSGYKKFKSADSVYDFVVNNNFYYLTNINQADVILLVGKFNNEHFERLFIETIDKEMARWLGATLTHEEAHNLSNVKLEEILDIAHFDTFTKGLFQSNRYGLVEAKKVYLDLEYRDIPLYNTFSLEYAKKIKETFPHILIDNCYNMIIKLRMIKDEEEVRLIKESINTTKNAIYNVMRHHADLTNESIAQAYHDFEIIKAGKVLSFNDIIASGHNATILHYDDNNSDIINDSLLLMDVGCYTSCYSSDITRTIPVSGKFTPRQKEVYEVVLSVNKKCIEYAKAGLSWKDLNTYANNLLVQGLIKLGKIKDETELRKYYFHSIGHSLGLDVHDPSDAKEGLKEGMVITIEPGLYIPEENIGIRIEDNILITKDKAILLSKDIIKEVSDIEEFMNK